MLPTFRLLAFFSRGKRVQRQAKPSNKTLSNLMGIDQNFSYLDGLSSIQIVEREVDNEELKQIRTLYEKNNYNCLQLLRKRQEKYLQKIGVIQHLETRLAHYMKLKIASYVKFRRWEDLLIDCQNRAKLISRQDQDSTEQMLQLYNQKCIGNILSDHDRLHSSLTFRITKPPQKTRKNQNLKLKEADSGLLTYSLAPQRAELIQKSEPCYEIYFETVTLQAIGLLVLGDRQRGLKLLSKLTGTNYSLEMKQQVYVLMITALSFQNKEKQVLSGQLMQKVSQCKALTESEALLMSSKCLNATDAQMLIDSVSKLVNQKPIHALPKPQLFKYGRLLCLLAQNYYLEGKKEDSERVLSLLSKLSEINEMKMFVTFIKMGINFDNRNVQQVIRLFESYKASEMDRQKQVAGKDFFELRTINNDLLRVNIYKLIISVYKDLNLKERQEEIRAEAQAMETTLLSYTLKQPEFNEDLIQKIDDWRLKTQIRIPYYYFNLKIEKHFQPNWFEDYSI